MSHQQKPNDDGRAFATLAYILPLIGGIVGLAVNRENALTRNHAQQSIGAILSVVVGVFIWAIIGYIIVLVPAIRPVVVALTYGLVILVAVFFLFRLATAPLDEKTKSRGTRRLVWVAVIYGIGGGLYFFSQTSPDLVAFTVPVIELLLPISELFMPVVLLVTIIVLGNGIIPSRISQVLSILIAINVLTWMPLAGPVISVAIFGLVIALFIFLVLNWIGGLVSAIQGKERVIPIANRLTTRLFGDVRKSKMVEATA